MEMSKTKVDKIGERIKEGALDAEILVQLSHYRNQFGGAYRTVEDLLSNKLELQVSGRPAKSTTAIIEKLKRESIRLTQVQDIAGCRVIVPGIVTQDRVVANLRVLLEKARVVDRRAAPSHGYRAVHIITVTRGMPVEVQIRTKPQHTWADISEKMADAYGQEIKYGQGNEAAVGLLADMSKEVERLEKLRYDKVMVRSGMPMRFHRMIERKSASKMIAELDRLDRQCLVRIRSILAREIKK